MDGGAWWAAVHGVTKSQIRLSDFTFTHWRGKWQPTPVFLPGESQGREPGGLPSMGLHRVGHDRRDLAAAALLHVPLLLLLLVLHTGFSGGMSKDYKLKSIQVRSCRHMMLQT